MTKAPFAGRLHWVAPGSKIALAGTAAIGAVQPFTVGASMTQRVDLPR
jgi:hypothetical protein